MKRNSFCMLLFFVCTYPQIVSSQTGLAGNPFIMNWLPKDFNGNAQNWDIAQDSRGIMYFANSDGLLEYDGVSWRLLDFGENSFARSLAIGADNNIYIGGKGEIGYFLPVNELQKNSGLKNPFSRKYVSLTRYLQPKDRDFTDVWRTCINASHVFFQTKTHIFRYTFSKNKNSNADTLCNNCMHTWTTDVRFGGLAIVNNHVYTAITKKGLIEIKNDSLISLPGSDKIENGFRFIVPYNDTAGSQKILIGSDDRQLYIYDGKECRLLTGAVAILLKHYDIYNAVALKDGTIAIATQGGGVIVINPADGGKIIQILNNASGLKADIIYNVNVDKQGALWIVSNNGISRAEIISPLSSYDETNGLNGVGYNIEKFQNQVYLATEVGVSYLQKNNITTNIQHPEFTPVHGIHNWTWCLLTVPEAKTLLVGTEVGIYAIRDHKATFLMPFKQDVVCMHRSALDSNRIFLGLRYGGIASIYYNRINNTWKDEGNIPGVNEYIYLINETTDGSLWLTAKYNPYLVRIIFPESNTNNKIHNPQVKHYDTTQGLPNQNMIHTTIIAKQLYAYAIGKVFKYNPSNDRFAVDTNIINFNHDGELIEEDKAGNVWFDCNNIIYRAIPGKAGGYTIDSVSFLRVEPQQYYSMFDDEENDAVWFAGSNELIHYDNRKPSNTNTDFPTLIRSVILIGNDSVMYDGLPADGTNDNTTLLYKQNSLRFTYAATSYDNPTANEYQYYLEGFDKGWSAWTSESKKDYTNLPEGNYQFHVRAKNIYKHLSSEAIYSFEVLSPWWRTWWAYILYAILFISVISLIIRWRISSVHKEKKILETKVAQRTAELKKEKEKVESTLSELKSTQAQLIQSEKMASLGELTAGIAHEIQNPLNFVNNFSEVSNELIEELRNCLAGRQVKNYELKINDPEIKELLNDIEQNLQKINHHGKRADAIVKGMLQHSQKSTGQKELTDINKLCDEYLRLAYHGMRAKDKNFNCEIKTDFDNTIPKINVVPQDIGRVILNLINNAFYAINEKKKLSANSYQPTAKIKTRKINDKVEIIIADNGNGIPEKIKDKIFQPFFTTKPTGQGTGLGLSLSYDIVKAHGGEIKVESKEQNGSEFIVVLPC